VGKAIEPPKWIKPQLPRLVDEAPAGPDRLHEIKYDGYRMHPRVDRGKAALLTLTGLDGFAEDGRGRLDGLHVARAGAGGLVYAGEVENGVPADMVRLKELLRPLVQKQTPIKRDRSGAGHLLLVRRRGRGRSSKVMYAIIIPRAYFRRKWSLLEKARTH
jgi:ATP-dependent DNA ligase